VERCLADLDLRDERAWTLVAALPTGATETEVAAGLEEPPGRAGRRLFRLRRSHLLHFQPAQARYSMPHLLREVARERAQHAGTWDDALARVARMASSTSE
jgi:hypothetical protein